MCGKLPFVWFSKSVTQASNSIVSNPGLIGKINIPKTIFPMALIHESLYRQAVVFLLLFVVVAVWGYEVSLNWLWVLPVALVQYLMIIACGLFGATLVCYFRDFSMLIPLGMIFLMFTSGIFWDVRALPDVQMRDIVLTYNPLAYLLDAYRQVLMYQSRPDLVQLTQTGTFFVVVIIITAKFMNKRSQELALKALSA
jgi:lipopolysaccharide transport system permease protein